MMKKCLARQNNVDTQNRTFHPFPTLPVELQLKIWSFAILVPRTVEIWSHEQHHTIHKSNGQLQPPKFFTIPSFSNHPLLHTSQVSREVFRAAYQRRLPSNLQGFVAPEVHHWVISSAHLVDYLETKAKTAENDEEILEHYFLNFEGERDHIFDAGRNSAADAHRRKWYGRCRVQNLLFDVRRFYRDLEGEEELGWKMVREMSDLKELTLVLLPVTREILFREGKDALMFVEEGDESVSRAERKELRKYKGIADKRIAKELTVRSRWSPPQVKYAVARLKLFN